MRCFQFLIIVLNIYLLDAKAALIQWIKTLSGLFPAISCLLSTVTLDLSQYAMDIGKAIASKASMDAQLI